VYRIGPNRLVDVVCDGFGRPQGLAFDAQGLLYVVDALAGSSGLYRLDLNAKPVRPELVLTAPSLVGVAFDAGGGIAVASNDTIWRIDLPTTP
jgi:sugar lactone lactonase YvrE